MTKTRSTKRALISSALALVICITMLIGTTFAWFTDSVTSANNIIKAGNLDVELEYSKDLYTWSTVTTSTNVFENSSLWEPGHTEVVYLRVSNKGSLALKYNLGVNVASETPGVNKAGNTFFLSDYIEYGVVKDVAAKYADRTAARAAVTSASKLNTVFNSGDYSLKGVENSTIDDDVFAMVVYMPETVGNEANHNGTAPVINLGITVLATQMTYENDSFDNQYDANAAFSVWDGNVPTEMPETLVVDGDTQTVHVKDAAAFAYLSKLSKTWADLYTDGNGRAYSNYANGAGAVYYYSGKWTVSLEADIDLNNHEITPVNIVIGQSTGHTPFKGNHHVIRNINTTTGLFEDSTRASFSDLTLENVKATNGALTGVATASISNVTVRNAAISGTNYVGGLVGRLFGNAIGCKVIDSYVIASGKEAGGLVGYAETNATTTTYIRANTVKNTSVYANNRAAGLVAQPNVNIKVYGNTVDTVTVSATDTTEYQPGAVVSNALAPANVYDNTVINANVNAGTVAATDSDELKDALNDGAKSVFLGNGNYSLPTMSGKEGVTIEGADDAVIGGDEATTGFGNNFGKDNTYKNLHFKGNNNGARWTYGNGGTVTFENCVFEGDVYGFHMDQSNGATLIFNDCTFIGFNAFAGDLVKSTFNRCDFKHSGYYGHTNIHSVGEFNECTWGDNTSVSPAKSSAKLYFNGVEESYHHEYIGSKASLVDFAKSVNEGNDSWNNQKVLLVNDIDLENMDWEPIGQTGATQFKGIFDGQGHTIKNLNVDSSAQTGEHYSSGLFGWVEGKITIKNVNIDGATVNGHHNVAALLGYTYSAQISNCHVSNATIVNTHANGDACGDKSGAIVGYAGNESRFTNCSASNSTITAGRDAGQLIGTGYNISVSGCSATNVTVSATGDCDRVGNLNNAIIGRVMG